VDSVPVPTLPYIVVYAYEAKKNEDDAGLGGNAQAIENNGSAELD
jgi:hypothetical protein